MTRKASRKKKTPLSQIIVLFQCGLCEEPAPFLLNGSSFCKTHRDDIIETGKKMREEHEASAKQKMSPPLPPKIRDVPEGFYG